jgi:hypothetical protein
MTFLRIVIPSSFLEASPLVIAGLDPAIHPFRKMIDHRVSAPLGRLRPSSTGHGAGPVMKPYQN